MKNLSIKIKLIIIFILIKIIPLFIIAYIAYEGVLKLDEYLKKNTSFLFNQNKEIIINTANASINDSIQNLDKKSQLSLERISYEIANNVAEFLYQRDEDILFLSKLNINQKTLEDFYKSKHRNIIVHDKYTYSYEKKKWISSIDLKKLNSEEVLKKADLEDNKKEFNFTNPIKLKRKNIPIYKEVVYFDLAGNEKYKVSQINKKLQNISKKENTYINSENYFKDIENLKNGEIYVSNVIGEYVKSKVIGIYNKEKTKKLGIPFEPEKSAYAGKENPNGKRFEGIIRFITPIFKNSKKIGYISIALDHEHMMQFTDTSNPTSVNPKQSISDASVGNYAFMFDYKGRNISHPRDYFIRGYDKKTGKYSKPWLSKKLAEDFEKSKKEINEYLKSVKEFDNQSLKKKPNIKQLIHDGTVGLDCRYLNFAPQCQGFMQVTKNGGYGSFIIYWSKVWKLTTAASIPYYTGQYNSTKRGFGFVSIGANVNEFHSAANKTRENVNNILAVQTKNIKNVVDKNELEINIFLKKLINELTVVTFIMVFAIIIIALWLSNYISRKIEKLLVGTKEFANNNLDYRIKITSNDEIAKLEKSFNNMALKIKDLIDKEKKINESLEEKVKEGIAKQREQEQLLIQQSKLASMGEMIGNIAHQWRQPLNALSLIIQNIQFAFKMGDLDDVFIGNSIKKANNLTNNMSKTIDDFRNFFKPNKLKEVINLNNLIRDSIELVNSTFKHHDILLIIEFNNEDIFIEGYPNEFTQVLINILNNAKDAFEESSTKAPKVVLRTTVENDFAIIKILDNATGVEDEIKERIFDPYFTTKEEGKGIGIGLYMSKIIIEGNMKGNINFINIDNGTMFIIKLPINKKF
ncbi:MAG: HAMP domain-containing histidine kinase [Arcobacter sp.]|nr:HAMP domain-containing histidine kinase [Arcobacter sp.]